MMHGVILILALLVMMTASLGVPRLERQYSALNPPVSDVPKTLFGMHIHHLSRGSIWPTVPFGTWRLWDAKVAWPHLNPEQDQWYFDILDEYVRLADSHGIELLLPLGLTPDWATSRPQEPSAYAKGMAAPPRDLKPWRNYVRTVATRYKGRIRYYEIWNEPNDRKFFSGTIEQMLTLSQEAYSILKSVDPNIILVSPSATHQEKGINWLNQYLSKGGGHYADVIGFHFYVSPDLPEDMLPLIRKIRAILIEYQVKKPLWNTESGWQIETRRASRLKRKAALSEDVAAAYVARSYILGWVAGLSRFYWYAWDNNQMGLLDADEKTIKAPALAYKNVLDWLVGTRIEHCLPDLSDTWICELSRGDYHAWILWNPQKTIDFSLPNSWRVTSIRHLNGTQIKRPGMTQVEVGPSPVLLERQ